MLHFGEGNIFQFFNIPKKSFCKLLEAISDGNFRATISYVSFASWISILFLHCHIHVPFPVMHKMIALKFLSSSKWVAFGIVSKLQALNVKS